MLSRATPKALFATPILLLVLATASARADEPKGEPPKVEPPSDIDLPFEKYTLDNGLEVILHRDTTAPLLTVNVWYHVGSGDEVPGKSGFAHLFEHMMFQGTKHTGSDVHFPILQAAGASDVNGTTNSDRTNYYETVPAHQIETALWLESDRMGFLLDALTEASFKNQVDVVRNERRQRYDNVPYAKARFAIAAALYPEGHPYRYMTIGRHEDLEQASIDDVRGFFAKWYVPSNATLVIAGDFEPADVKALVAKWFGGLGMVDGKATPRPAKVPVPNPEIAKITTVDVPDGFAKLVKIQRAYAGPAMLSDESYPLEVVLEVLGADAWGRLSKRLVIQNPLCSAVGAMLDDATYNGKIIIAATLKPGADRAKVAKIIDEEVARIQKEPISEAELHRVLVGSESQFVWGLEDVAARADLLQHFNHYMGDPGYAPKHLAKMRAVTVDAVLASAKSWLGKPYAEVVTVPAAPTKGPKPGQGAPK